MTIEEANYLGPGDWLRVSQDGLGRHQIDGTEAEGVYVTQFESPKNGRLVVVKLVGRGAFGFRLEELEVLRKRSAAGKHRAAGD